VGAQALEGQTCTVGGARSLGSGLGAAAQCPSPSRCRFAAIHAEAPEFVEMSVEQEILVTGIKVVDLLAPYAKGGKIGTLAPEERGVWGGGSLPAPLSSAGGSHRAPEGAGPLLLQPFPSLMSNRLTFVLLSLLKQRLSI